MVHIRHSLMIIMLAFVALQTEDCAKKTGDKTTSATTIPDSLKRYPFRSAIIELRYSGSAKGKQMIYIDDFGLKEANIDSLTMNMMGMELPNYKMHVQNGDSVYEVDFVRGLATKGVSHLSAGDRKAMSSMGEEMAKGMGMKKLDKEEVVAGQPCTVWASAEMGTTSWLWHNISLKSESRIGDDTIHLEAVSVHLDVPVPSERFDPPGGVHYTTQEEIESMLDKIDKNARKERGGKEAMSK